MLLWLSFAWFLQDICLHSLELFYNRCLKLVTGCQNLPLSILWQVEMFIVLSLLGNLDCLIYIFYIMWWDLQSFFKSEDGCWLYFLPRGINAGKSNPDTLQHLLGFVFGISILLSHFSMFSSSLGVLQHIYYVLEVTQYVEPLCRWQLYWWHVQCSFFKVY